MGDLQQAGLSWEKFLKRGHGQWNVLNNLLSDNCTAVCEAAHERMVTLLRMFHSLGERICSMLSTLALSDSFC